MKSKAILLLLWAWPLLAQPTNVRVVGTTSTRAFIRYTAPSTAACTLRVSEESDFTPLHPDVDSSLFSGANSDGGGPVEREWLIGKRGAWATTDAGDVTSRALRASMAYHFDITCGSAVAGTFVTAPIPWGNIYDEPIAPAVAGGQNLPTQPTSGRWWGPHPTTGAYFGFPLHAPNDATDLRAIHFDTSAVVTASGNWTTPDNAKVDDDAFFSTATASDALRIDITDAIAASCPNPEMTGWLVRVKECSHSGAGQDIDARVSLNNGFTWSDWKTASCPSVAADVDIGDGGTNDFWGLPPPAGTGAVELTERVNDAGAGTAPSTTIELGSAADCAAVKVGDDLFIHLPVENDAITTYPISSKDCTPGSETVVINTSIDLENGGRGQPALIRGSGFANNSNLSMELRMASGGSGTITADAIWFVRNEDGTNFDQMNAGFAREHSPIVNSNGWTLTTGVGAQIGCLPGTSIYAIKDTGRHLTINPFAGSAFSGNLYGGASINTGVQ
ncbi:MAG: hypothetical protein OER77_10655, partial [Myxococcales bacterium]|nr:hypothetical protein [Myxococcales bacterium]